VKSCVVLLALLVVPITAYGHAEIFFPKVFSVAELPTTGFVLLNPDTSLSTVNIYLLSTSGSVISGPALRRIEPGGQLSQLGRELFPTATNSGWVYVINDTEGMQAFWLNYDAGTTFMDGAEAFQYETIGADQIVPLVAGQSELNIINPNFTATPITIRLFGRDGELAPASSRQLPIAGALQAQASVMFPGVDMSQARYLRIQSGLPIASTVLIRGFLVPIESAVINGSNVGTGTSMSFPHVINGALTGANYTTVIGVTNVSSATQSVTITLNPDGGSPISINRTLPANGALRETALDLFGLPTTFQGGWVNVTGTAPVAGFAAYADIVGGAIAVVPAGDSQTSLFFSHIADGPPQWQTGVALLNAGSDSALVEVYAMTPSGALIGKTTLSLSPGVKLAKVIHELIPETRGVNGGFVFVRTTNNVPLYGIELFYTEDLKVLSNVAAGKLSGINFVPPGSF